MNTQWYFALWDYILNIKIHVYGRFFESINRNDKDFYIPVVLWINKETNCKTNTVESFGLVPGCWIVNVLDLRLLCRT